jgi:hypothetical protein
MKKQSGGITIQINFEEMESYLLPKKRKKKKGGKVK